MYKALFILSLVAFSFGQFGRLTIGNGVAITVLDIVVGSLGVIWVTRAIWYKKFKAGYLMGPILLFFGIGCISLLINLQQLQSDQAVVAFLYGFRWLLYAMLYYAVKDFDREFRQKILNLFIMAGGIVVMAGYIQYFFYNNLRNLYYLGWDDHLYRMFSVFLDPNFAGVFFALYLFLLFGKFVDSDARKKRKHVFVYGLLSLLTILALVLTYSRSGLIAFAVGMSVYLVMTQSKKLVLPILGIGVLFLLLLSNTAVEGRNPFRVVSSQERLKSIGDAIHIIQENPFIGVGFNAYRYAQNRYGFRTSGQWETSHADAGTDNSLLFVLATTGIVGFLAYIYLWIKVIKGIWGVKGKKESNVRVVVLVSACGLLASSLFLNTLFYPMLMYWMWILLAVTENT